ncbi:CHAT domain-containing protein [Mycena sanguinolenta]|nr:CHAT domain-containing protein [Mycena sanguinolenta]
MFRTIHLHNIRVRSLVNPHADLPTGMQMFAQLMVDGAIIQQTMPVDVDDTQDFFSWKLRFDCDIPSNAPTFRIAIMRKALGFRLVGTTEIARGEALSSGEQRNPFRLPIMKVNFDGPMLHLSAAFSVNTDSTSLSMNDIHGIKVGSLIIQAITEDLGQMLRNSMLMKMEVATQELWVMHERILHLSISNNHRGKLLYLLGTICVAQWEVSYKLDTVNQAVLAHEDAVRDGLVDADSLHGLGIALLLRVEQLDEVGDIIRSVQVMEDAIGLVPDGHPEKASMLSNFAICLFRRFARYGALDDLDRRLGNLDDLTKSVLVAKKAVHLALDNDPEKAGWMNNLGNSLLFRFHRLGNLDDLNESVTMGENAVRFAADNDNDLLKSGFSKNLADSLHTRFQRLGNLDDLNRSVLMAGDAVYLTPEGHPDKPSRLSNLANSLLDHFEWHRDRDALDRSVLICEDALKLAPDDHPSKRMWFNRLGQSLLTRFEWFGDLDDLHRSVLMREQAVQMTPHGHHDMPEVLSNLGNCLRTRFQRLGDLGDLNRSISITVDAVHLTPDGHPGKAYRLNNLGGSLLNRFQQIGDLDDLNWAVAVKEDAVRLTPDGHSHKPMWLVNLGAALVVRFKRCRNLDDLNKSISANENALHLTPHGHPHKPLRLHTLGTSLQKRFEQLGDLHDLNRSVLIQEEAVSLTPDDHFRRLDLLFNLGSILFIRYQQLGDLDDINRSVESGEEALRLTPDGHTYKSLGLSNLGKSLHARFVHLGDRGDLQHAILVYTSAARSTTGSSDIRFTAAANWAELAKAAQHPSVMDAYHVALGLLPELAWLGLSIGDRHYQLLGAGKVVRDAAAAAISSGQAELAVEWLEQGRSIIWGQILNLRSPVDMLSAQHPGLAKQLLSLSALLEGSGSRMHRSENMDSGPGSLQLIENQAHQSAHHRQELLKQIRGLEGFSQFLLPRTISELSQAAQRGPVAILNVSNSRCDALILIPGLDDEVMHIPLTDFTLEDAGSLAQGLGQLVHRGRLQGLREGQIDPEDALEQHLSKLWLGLVKPVLEGLAITNPTQTNLSRIWWCPTGPLAFLPIHASGLYGKDEAFASKLSDFVISSYTPSLTALIEGFRAHPESRPKAQLLAVAQPSAIGQKYIPGTQKEIEHVQRLADGKLPVLKLVKDMATVEAVQRGMRDSNWVHFACHGVQNIKNPTESALLLAGSSRLTLLNIIQLALPHADFAFLSACQTAAGDKTLEEESVHLAAGMLLAGYRGVIGTMWSVMDNDAPKVASDVYEHLFNTSQPDPAQAAEALHLAIQKLRRESGGKKSLSRWVPFIHIGV